MSNARKTNFDNVSKIASAELCCFCGCCAAVCPTKSIKMNYNGSFPYPVVDNDKCKHCGLCVKVCPGWGVDFDCLNEVLFGNIPKNKITGHYQNIYTGAVTDREKRYQRTSGGIAKEIASWGLENNYFSAVVVSNFKEDDPLKSCTDLVYSPEEIDNSASSIYAPVTACTVLDQLKDISGRICFIGIPCHIQALRKAQRNVRWLKDREIFAVGIFCSWTAGAYATRAFLGYHNIQLQNVKNLVYRSEGWPGKIRIHMKDCANPTFFSRGREANFIARLKYGAAFNRRGFFASQRCLSCPDHLAELADISLGDAWKITPPNDLGLNTIITRSDQSDLVLNELSSAKRIFKDPITCEDLIKSQAKNLASKKKAFLIWNILSKKDKKIPVFSGQPVLEANIFEKIVAKMEIASIKLGKKGVCWKFLPYLAPLISMLRRLAGKRMKTI